MRCNTAIAIVPSTPKIQFTYEDYLELPDDGKRYEIIAGELYMSTSPTPNHQKIVRNFLFALILYLKRHPIGQVMQAPLEVFFSQTNAKFGVQEYWLAKEKTAAVEIFRLQKGELVPVARLEKAAVLTSPLFPGLEVPLDEIFTV